MTTWSTTDKDTDIALTGGNLIATKTGTGYGAARSTTSKSTGKWVFKATWNTLGNTSEAGIGFAASTADLNNWVGFGTNQGVGFYMDGTIWFNGANSGSTWAGGTAPTSFYLAIDVDAETVRASANGTTWSTAFSIAAATGPYFAMGNGFTLNDQFVADFNPTGWTLATYSAWDAAAGDTVTVDVGTITVAGQTIGEIEVVPVTNGSVTLAGQDIGEIETVPVTNGTVTLAGQDITLTESGTETVPVTEGAVTLAGQDITVTESGTETVAVDQGTITLAGQDISIADTGAGDETVSIDTGSITLAGQTITVTESGTETIPVVAAALTLLGQDITVSGGEPEVPVAGAGGGGGWSDEAYYGTRKREQEKRDRERKLWKGDPARVVPDKAPPRPTDAPAVSKSVTPGATPEESDPLQELLALMALENPILLTTPRPSRVFNPEDDVAVILLSDL